MGNCTSNNDDKYEYGTDAFWADQRNYYLNDANRPYKNVSRDIIGNMKRDAEIKKIEKEIKELGYCGTGRKYGVSDNAIRKWLKAY